MKFGQSAMRHPLFGGKIPSVYDAWTVALHIGTHVERFPAVFQIRTATPGHCGMEARK
jgi:hypothetical protein